jgi:hypothetical protein
MRYRLFGRTGRYISVIAGNEIFPLDVTRKALDCGINFWHKTNGCEYPATRKPHELSDGLRKKKRRKAVMVEFSHGDEPGITRDKLIAEFKDALVRFRFDSVDFYKMHGIYSEEGVAAFKELKQQGLVRHLAASLHYTLDEIKAFVDRGDLDAIQIMINSPMIVWSRSESGQDLRKLCAHCKKKSIGVIGMKTMVGGPRGWRFMKATVKQLKEYFPDTKSIAQAIVKDVLSIDGLSSCVIACRTMRQFSDTVGALSLKLSARERKGLDLFAAAVRGQFCQSCGHCEKTCPQRIPVAQLMRAELYRTAYDDPDRAWKVCRSLPASRNPNACSGCARCEQVCPHGIPIVRRLSSLRDFLA